VNTVLIDPSQPMLLVASVRAALKNGVLHSTTMGMPLCTDVEVISALTQFGKVNVDYSHRVIVTTPDLELAEMQRDGVGRG
jgi:hypothetical protein